MLDQIMPILTQAIVSVLGVIISVIATKAVGYLNVKKQEIVEKIGANKYNLSVSIAEAIFYGIEQEMKSATGNEKRFEFNKRIAAKIPWVSADDIDHLREAIVGKSKALAKVITTPVPVSVPVSVPYASVQMPWQNPVVYSAADRPEVAETFECTTTNSVNDVVVKSTHKNPKNRQAF